MQVLMTKRIN